MRSALASNSAVLALHHMQPSMSLERLAAIGARGRQPGNCHRDLLEWLGQPRSPPPTNFDIPIKDPKPKRLQAAIRDLSQPIFLPHVEFAHAFSQGREVFAKRFLGGGLDAFDKVNAF